MIRGWPQHLLWNPCGNCGQDPCECGRRSESPEMTTVVGKWGILSLRLNAAAKDGARTYLVLRARRIWGLLGNKLRRSMWCKAWRMANAVPEFVFRWVKVWRVNNR